ncbi:MAG: hypothetical protein ACOYN6_07665 [Ignavibacteria bacterium]
MRTTILALTFVALLFLTSCGKIVSNETNKFHLNDVPTIDKYSGLIIQSSRIKEAGHNVGGKVLNDRVTLDLYIPDYTADKGKDVCKFYREYYKTLANKLDGLLEVEIRLYNAKQDANLIGKKEGNIAYKGGMVFNYATEQYDENIMK